jgi:hypothetical protein
MSMTGRAGEGEGAVETWFPDSCEGEVAILVFLVQWISMILWNSIECTRSFNDADF